MRKSAAFLLPVLRRVAVLVQHLCDFAWRAIFTSRPIQVLHRWTLSRYKHLPWPNLKVVLVAHVHYTDVTFEILRICSCIPPESLLLITTNGDKKNIIAKECAGAKRVTVMTVPNRGRDIAPFLELLNKGVLDEFDVVLKLHSKRSPHLFDGNLRRRMLFLSLAGSEGAVKRILYAFAQTNAGLIGAKHSFRSHRRFWTRNEDRVEMVKRRMRPTPPAAIGFFGGTMFWARVSALAPLKEANFALDEFETEQGQLDGTLHHAIERVFGLSALAAGFDVRSLSGKILLSNVSKYSLSEDVYTNKFEQ